MKTRCSGHNSRPECHFVIAGGKKREASRKWIRILLLRLEPRETGHLTIAGLGGGHPQSKAAP